MKVSVRARIKTYILKAPPLPTKEEVAAQTKVIRLLIPVATQRGISLPTSGRADQLGLVLRQDAVSFCLSY
jgi:hypothetical protein